MRSGWILAVWMTIGVLLLPAARAQEIQFNQAELVRSLLPQVVNITARAEIASTPTADLTASAEQPSQSFEIRVNVGSGFIVDPSGIIATNWHVVDGAYEIFATFSDGARVKAEVLNAARILDLAILKVKPVRPIAAIHWGDSAKVQIGDPVLAIGNPLGVGLSVTAGIVSALNRNIMDTPYDDFIQTDAPINHGNSGGPLFNMQGEVIGVNTALISPTAASAGLGFAIPAEIAKEVIDRLLRYGWVRPGWMGVKIQQVTPEMAEAIGLPEPEGSVVAWVIDGGPAAAAGLRIGDVILKFGSAVPTDERALLRAIASSAPGRNVTIGILRGGKPMDLPVTLAEWPKMQWEERDAPTKAAEPHWTIPQDLGLTVQPLTSEQRAKNQLPPGPGEGVLVTSVRGDVDAARRGVAAGDVILRVGDTQVSNAHDLQAAIDAARESKRSFAMFLVVPKRSANAQSRFPGPKWIPLRVLDS
jgi:serine protease Do